MKRYAKVDTLSEIFDIQKNWFENRQDKSNSKNKKMFFENIHYFVQDKHVKTKKIVLWNIEAVEKTLRGESIEKETQNIIKAILE